MPTILSYLVGAHHHPPAKAILAVLPAGAPLDLIPEPDNPYDANALQVWVSGDAIPVSQYESLSENLLRYGRTISDIIPSNSEEIAMIWLGFVAMSGGKPAKGLPGNVEMLYAMSDSNYVSQLAFDGMGEPMVELSYRQP